MLTIVVPGFELYNDKTEEFTKVKEHVLQLEHSLVSISKWESVWCKPFMSKEEKTVEQSIDYIRWMTITPKVDPLIYTRIPNSVMLEIANYVEAPMTATIINQQTDSKPRREVITSELIYYWMIALNIPFECQKWHLNRLLALIGICNIKNAPPSKTNKGDILKRNHDLNEARKKQLNSNG